MLTPIGHDNEPFKWLGCHLTNISFPGHICPGLAVHETDLWRNLSLPTECLKFTVCRSMHVSIVSDSLAGCKILPKTFSTR
jgi:hypothetical protein